MPPLRNVPFAAAGQTFCALRARPCPGADAKRVTRELDQALCLSSISRKANSQALALITSCSTPALRK